MPLRVTAYRIPQDPTKDRWMPEVLDESLHVAHNFHPIDVAGTSRKDILVASYEGVNLLKSIDGKWKRQHIGIGNQERIAVLVEGLRRIGWDVNSPKASMFVWARYPAEWRERMGSLDFAMKLIEEAEVAVSPGRGFGEAGEGYLRLALVENEHRLRQAIRQIARCLRVETPDE